MEKKSPLTDIYESDRKVIFRYYSVDIEVRRTENVTGNAR